MEALSWIDIAIMSVIFISIIVSVIRGFIKEAITLLIWIVAGFAAYFYGKNLGDAFSFIKTEVIRSTVGAVVIFFGVLLLGGVVRFLIEKIVKFSGVAPIDRVLGAIFGLLRGAAIIVVVVMLVMTTPMIEQAWYKESKLIPKFSRIAQAVVEHMPMEWKDKTSALLKDFSI